MNGTIFYWESVNATALPYAHMWVFDEAYLVFSKPGTFCDACICTTENNCYRALDNNNFKVNLIPYCVGKKEEAAIFYEDCIINYYYLGINFARIFFRPPSPTTPLPETAVRNPAIEQNTASPHKKEEILRKEWVPQIKVELATNGWGPQKTANPAKDEQALQQPVKSTKTVELRNRRSRTSPSPKTEPQCQPSISTQRQPPPVILGQTPEHKRPRDQGATTYHFKGRTLLVLIIGSKSGTRCVWFEAPNSVSPSSDQISRSFEKEINRLFSLRDTKLVQLYEIWKG